MSETTNGTAERLEAARRELQELETQAARIDRDLDAARKEDHEDRMEAVRGGGFAGIREAIAGLRSRAREVSARRESLPDLVHSARVLVLERELQHLEASIPELAERSDAASRETREAEEAAREAERRYQALSDASYAALRELNQAGNRRQQARVELEALDKAGPQGYAT